MNGEYAIKQGDDSDVPQLYDFRDLGINEPRWGDPEINLGSSVVVAGRSEPGDAYFAGQTGVIAGHGYILGVGNTYIIDFSGTLESGILPSLVNLA